MDCQTATLLIEAYHDDELELVDAARLLAHLESCPSCRIRCDESARLRDTVRAGRPVDRCPEELARRVARRVELPSGPRRRASRIVVVVAVAGGGGLALGWIGARATAAPGRSVRIAHASRRLDADVFCLRCALHALWPNAVAESGPHRPLLRTADGRIWVVDPDSPAGARLGEPGPAPRHVVVTAALDERSGVADVSEVDAAPAAGTAFAR